MAIYKREETLDQWEYAKCPRCGMQVSIRPLNPARPKKFLVNCSRCGQYVATKEQLAEAQVK